MADKDFGPRIGADPEVFVRNAEGVTVPICGHIGGTKEKPIVVTSEMNKIWGKLRGSNEAIGDYAMQEDNVMLEFNVPAWKDCRTFAYSIRNTMEYLDSAVLAPKGLVLYPGSSVQKFPRTLLESLPQAQAIGCLPDLDAYAVQTNYKRAAFTATDLGEHRFCGGHIHVQYNKENVPPPVFVKFMDILYLQNLMWDKQKERRKFYGQPGIFREKEYGIEYRTPSNFWLKPEFRDGRLEIWADNIIRLAETANTDPSRLKAMYAKITNWDEIRKAISNEDNKLCTEILQHHAQIGVSI